MMNCIIYEVLPPTRVDLDEDRTAADFRRNTDDFPAAEHSPFVVSGRESNRIVPIGNLQNGLLNMEVMTDDVPLVSVDVGRVDDDWILVRVGNLEIHISSGRYTVTPRPKTIRRVVECTDGNL